MGLSSLLLRTCLPSLEGCQGIVLGLAEANISESTVVIGESDEIAETFDC